MLTIEDLRECYGNECEHCTGTERLEFAHIMPTQLRGRSRGSKERAKDIIRNPHAYVLLCNTCHRAMDLPDER